MDNKKENPEEISSNKALTPLDTAEVSRKLEELTRDFIYSDNASETQAILEKYNAYLVKKSAIRTGKLEALYDEIVEQMLLRFKHRGGEFSNKDLLDYLNSVQTAIEKSANRLNNTDEAPVQFGNPSTQVNINVLDGFTHEQKTNIADAIKSIIQSASTPTYFQGEFEDVDENTDTNNNLDENPDTEGEDN